MNRVFVKKVSSKEEVDAEVFGVRLLSKYVNTPKIIDFNGQSITYEFIEEGGSDEKKAAEMLYKLHRVKGEKFGLEKDNFIGKGRQINKQTDNCKDFYLNYRLGAQTELLKDKRIKSSSLILLDTLNRKWSPKCSVPSLCHGDLWIGNILYDKNKEPVLIDPAVYFGDPVSDLAMAELFGGLNSIFFNHYFSLSGQMKSDLDFKIYQLYHALNHVNIFGSSYNQMVEKLIYDISSMAESI